MMAGSFTYEKVLNICSEPDVRSTGLEPVPVAGHAPQTCAYADSATTANKHRNYKAERFLCQAEKEKLAVDIVKK